MLPRIASALVLALATLLGAVAHAQVAEPWVDGLAFPTNMAFAPDGRAFVTEKATGRVRVIAADGGLRIEPFITLPVSDAGETGMLGIALDPGFDRGEPWVYLYRSDPASGMNEVLRVRADGDRAAGEPELLTRTVPATDAYHNGGDMVFGADGMLYVAVGEAHDPGRAQDVDDLGGKILRLSPDGTPAPGNPFGDGVAAYTIGHRNSFGLCVDPDTGVVWETENGPDENDEVNRLVGGKNYGWPETTGTGDARFTDPVAVFPRTVALTGCAWWQGDLYVGAYGDGELRTVAPDTGEVSGAFSFGAGVTDLQVGPDGALYVVTEAGIWRIEDPGASGTTSTSTPATTSVPATTTLGPTPSPAADPGSGGRSWIVAVAAVILGGSLALRLWAGRRAGR